ncbi:MAG: hypothetical protein LBV49_03605 [Azonexus sp.]|jgi:hypothetical protein|nr:hypothetical protein [Azonexus sp.]
MKKNAFLVSLAVIISGCASVAVNEESLQSRTAFALGLEQGDFTISNRSDDGVRTDYTVTTNKKQVFSCYVTGVVSITGRNVSDAICSEKSSPAATAGKGKNAEKKPAGKASGCNDLLRAAGRC